MRFSRILRGWFIPVCEFDADNLFGLRRRSSSGVVELTGGVFTPHPGWGGLRTLREGRNDAFCCPDYFTSRFLILASSAAETVPE